MTMRFRNSQKARFIKSTTAAPMVTVIRRSSFLSQTAETMVTRRVHDNALAGNSVNTSNSSTVAADNKWNMVAITTSTRTRTQATPPLLKTTSDVIITPKSPTMVIEMTTLLLCTAEMPTNPTKALC